MQETYEDDESETETDKDDPACIISFIPKRYMVTILAMFGLFNAYTLRVNMSVAIVAMVSNTTKFNNSNGVNIEVCKLYFSRLTVRNKL